MKDSGGASTFGTSGEINLGGSGAKAVDRLGATVLDEFELVEILAEGTYSTAFVAEQVGADRQAVVKIVRRDVIDSLRDGFSVDRLQTEVHERQQIEHAHLARVLAAGATKDGLPVVATEYVEGDSLASLLDSLGEPLPVDLLEPCFSHVGSALEAMHEAGLAHHDFSASSIVIGYDAGDMPYATLLDGDSGQLHEAGEGAASDMHALGAVLWRAITGSRFERVSPDDEGAPDPRRVRSELPGGLAEMVSQLLSPQEDERPTAAEFVAAWPSLVATFESVPSESSSEPESPEPASPQFLPPTLSDAPTLRSGIVLPLITGKTVTVPAITDDEEPPVPPTTGKKGPKPPSISDKKAPAPPVVTAKRSPTPPVITGRTVMTPAAAAGEIHTPSSSFQPPSRPTNGGSNLRAVVVESNPFTRRLLERRLQRAGVSVTLVSDVGQISAEHRPDLAFVRAEFDGPDPYGIVEQVRAEVPGLPVVLTAPPDTEVGEAWRGRDVLDVLVAPSEFDRLAPLLARMRAP